MTIAVIEAARTLEPLGVLISNVTMRLINFVFNVVRRYKVNDRRAIENLAYALSFEFPHEPKGYVYTIAVEKYKESNIV